MKIAICLSGNLGNKRRSGKRRIKSNAQLLSENDNGLYDPKLGYEHLNKILLSKYDCDVFFHCWSNDKGANTKLVQLYKPKDYIIEPQKNFDIDIEKYGMDKGNIDAIFRSKTLSESCKIGYKLWFNDRKKKGMSQANILQEIYTQAFRTSSRLYSFNESYNLMKIYEQKEDIKYDWILFCRFDSFWNFPIHNGKNNVNLDLSKFNKENVYVERRNGRADFNYAIQDLWFLLSNNNVKAFDNIFNRRHNYCIRGPFMFFKMIEEKVGLKNIKNIY